MKFDKNNKLVLAPTDFSKHLGCKHLTVQNLTALKTGNKPPFISSPVLETLQELGNKHEKDYLEFLRDEGKTIAESKSGNSSQWISEAIKNGTDVIYHPRLTNDRWSGEADFLIKRTDGDKTTYEAYDTKLARKTRAQTLLQLYVYSLWLIEMAPKLGIEPPNSMYVVTPIDGFNVENYRIDDFAAYLRYLDKDFAHFIENPADSYPEAIPFCDFCNCWTECNKRRRKDDYLGFVAGISSSQRATLAEVGIKTLEQLAVAEKLPRKSSGSYASLQNSRKQAALQLQARQKETNLYELKPLSGDEPHGLSLLPAPTADDIFLDFEGDHFAQEGKVVEYLTGYVTHASDGYSYKALWATTPAEEKAAFESFIDFAVETYNKNPDAHIYHFAPYEDAALKRLMIKYSTREIKLDLLLEKQVLVDLHKIVKKSLFASVEKYSLKDLEVFLDFEREQDLGDVGQSMRLVEGVVSGSFVIDKEKLQKHQLIVEDYNREDCLATLELQRWLESLRDTAIKDGLSLSRPEKPDAKKPKEKEVDLEIAGLRRQLLRRLPDDLIPVNDEEQAILLLANLVGYYRREQKANAWDYFRLMELPIEDYAGEGRAIAGLEFVEVLEAGDKPVVRFSYPPQEVVIKNDSAMRVPGIDGDFGNVEEVSYSGHTVDIKIHAEHEGYPLFLNSPEKIFSTTQHQKSLFTLAKSVADDGIHNLTTQPLAKSLLLREPPKHTGGSLQLDGESVLDAAIRITRTMNSDVLAIQGPPGTGKTYTGANIILDLVASGKRLSLIHI